MKVIDLLNKIANGGEVPKKIKYDGMIWKFEEDKLYYSDNVWLDDYCNISQILNDEVEILKEEKKIPEKFKINYEIDEENTINLTPATMLECDLACRINEIIDYLKSKGE